MQQAADKDRRNNEAKLPATAKLAMLDEVMSVLRKYVYLIFVPEPNCEADVQCDIMASYRGLWSPRSGSRMARTYTSFRGFTGGRYPKGDV